MTRLRELLILGAKAVWLIVPGLILGYVAWMALADRDRVIDEAAYRPVVTGGIQMTSISGEAGRDIIHFEHPAQAYESLLVVRQRKCLNEHVELDGQHFVKSEFIDCKLHYRADRRFMLEGGRMEGCEVTFGGTADGVVALLRAVGRCRRRPTDPGHAVLSGATSSAGAWQRPGRRWLASICTARRRATSPAATAAL